MLESGLFFTLGFLAAALLALMVAPAIWRRAVSLTRQRIESSVPLTLNEIQADKDQLRAEFAMSTRRLEVSLDELKERAAEQMIEINRRRDEALALEDVQAKKQEKIAELQGQSDELRAEMRDREEKLSKASLNLANIEAQLVEKTGETERLEHRYQEVIAEFDDQKNVLVSNETRLGTVSDEARALKTKLKEMQDALNTVSEQKTAAEAALKREKDRTLELDKKTTRLQSAHLDMEARLERRDMDIKKLRDKQGDSDTRTATSEDKLNKIQAENVKLKAELADAALRTEALLNDASSENVKGAAEVFEREREDLKQKLHSTEAARQKLQNELGSIRTSSGEEWEVERRENAIVRERINDLAAQVTAMTASIEGPGSTINKVLTEETRAPGTETEGSAEADVRSLADRIRALQEDSEKA